MLPPGGLGGGPTEWQKDYTLLDAQTLLVTLGQENQLFLFWPI